MYGNSTDCLRTQSFSESSSSSLRMDESGDFVESEAEESGEESDADSSDESEGEGGKAICSWRHFSPK